MEDQVKQEIEIKKLEVEILELKQLLEKETREKEDYFYRYNKLESENENLQEQIKLRALSSSQSLESYRIDNDNLKRERDRKDAKIRELKTKLSQLEYSESLVKYLKLAKDQIQMIDQNISLLKIMEEKENNEYERQLSIDNMTMELLVKENMELKEQLKQAKGETWINK